MKNLNENIKKVWLIYYLLIFISIFCSLFLIRIFFLAYIKKYSSLYQLIAFAILGFYILIVPIILRLIYLKYKYSIKMTKIEISYGIFFIRTIIIPFNKIQHIEIRENPINKIFNLITIKFFTANKIYSIQGLSQDEIEKIYKCMNET